MQLSYAASSVYPWVSSQRERKQMAEKAPAQIATMSKHATNAISNVPLWHCCQEFFRNPGVKNFFFSDWELAQT